MTTQITIPTDATLIARTINRKNMSPAARRAVNNNKSRVCNMCGIRVNDWFEIKQASGEYITENNGVATRVCTECTDK